MPILKTDEMSYNKLDVYLSSTTIKPSEERCSFFLEELQESAERIKSQLKVCHPETKITKIVFEGDLGCRMRIVFYREETNAEYAERMVRIKEFEEFRKKIEERTRKAAQTRAKKKREREYKKFLKLKEKFEDS
jgi:hypothetical protein